MPILNSNYMYLERDGIDLTAHYTSVRSLEEFEYRYPRPMGFSPDYVEQAGSVGYEMELYLVVKKERISEYKKYLGKNSVCHTVFDYNGQLIEGPFEVLRLEERCIGYESFWILEVAMRSISRP